MIENFFVGKCGEISNIFCNFAAEFRKKTITPMR